MHYGKAAATLISTLAISSFFIVGCSDSTKSNSFSIDESAGKKPTSVSGQAGLEVGIGDIESNFRLYVLLDESSQSNTIAHSEEFTKLEWIARASIDIAPPYPPALNLMVFSRSIKDYPNQIYRTTVNLYKEDEIVHSYKFITGNQSKNQIRETIVDVMPFIEATPGKSILMHVRAEFEFFPDTEDESITIDSPAPPNTLRATKMGNPLRITFAP